MGMPYESVLGDQSTLVRSHRTTDRQTRVTPPSIESFQSQPSPFYQGSSSRFEDYVHQQESPNVLNTHTLSLDPSFQASSLFCLA